MSRIVSRSIDSFDREIVTPLRTVGALFTRPVKVIGSKVIDIAGLKHDPARGSYPNRLSFFAGKKKLGQAGSWQQSFKTIQVAFFKQEVELH